METDERLGDDDENRGRNEDETEDDDEGARREWSEVACAKRMMSLKSVDSSCKAT